MTTVQTTKPQVGTAMGTGRSEALARIVDQAQRADETARREREREAQRSRPLRTPRPNAYD